jgi:hypothetical protein
VAHAAECLLCKHKDLSSNLVLPPRKKGHHGQDRAATGLPEQASRVTECFLTHQLCWENSLYTLPPLLLCTPVTNPTNLSRATQPLEIAAIPRELPCLTPSPAQDAEPSSQASPGPSWVLRGHMSKHNRRTCRQKTEDQRFEESIHCPDRAQQTYSLLNKAEVQGWRRGSTGRAPA